MGHVWLGYKIPHMIIPLDDTRERYSRYIGLDMKKLRYQRILVSRNGNLMVPTIFKESMSIGYVYSG